MIYKNCMYPPDSDALSELWPWPVKIYCHGQFKILLHGTVLKYDRRPFELLKVLLTFGGRNVSEEKIMGVLWPDSDGDQARSNFKVTLHRLREIDPLTEIAYQGLIRCHIARGSQSEAQKVYQEFEMVLLAFNGSTPSLDTKKLLMPTAK